MKHLYSFWLLPEEQDNNYLQQIISSLAKGYDAPVFQPHLTLFGLAELSEEDAIGVTNYAALDNVASKAIVKKLNYTSDLFFKTVFIEIENNPTLTTLNGRFEEKIGHLHDYTFDPHISIIYKKISDKTKKEIISKTHVKDSFLMNRVVTVYCGDTEQDLYDIKWNIVHEVMLK